MYRKCSNYLLFTIVMLAFEQVYCLTLKDNKKDLIAEASFYEPSYQYSPPPLPPPVEHGSAYKKYSDDHNSYGKYNKAYGDTGYNHYGNQDQYLDHGYADQALKKYNDYGSKDKYSKQHAHYGNDYGNGLYTRDRGYGYEKHYAYDKELATKAFGSEHADKDSNYGDHSKYDHSGLDSHGSSGHHKSGANKKYLAAGHNKYGHSNGAYGDQQKHYGSAAKVLHLTSPYTHYSTNYEPETHYEPSVASYPNYPAYKPAFYKPEIYSQQSYHDEPVVASSGNHYEPASIQSTYLSQTPHQSPYPPASTSYAAANSLHHPGVAYY